MKKRDFALIFTLIAIGVFMYVLVSPNKAAQTALVYYDGNIVWERDINHDGEFTVNGVTVQVKNGAARISESDCPNGECKRAGSINKAGQSVVCLPNKVSLILEDDGMDAVLY